MLHTYILTYFYNCELLLSLLFRLLWCARYCPQCWQKAVLALRELSHIGSYTYSAEQSREDYTYTRYCGKKLPRIGLASLGSLYLIWSLRRLFQPPFLMQFCCPLQCERFPHSHLRSAFSSVSFLLLAVICTHLRLHVLGEATQSNPIQTSPCSQSPSLKSGHTCCLYCILSSNFFITQLFHVDRSCFPGRPKAPWGERWVFKSSQPNSSCIYGTPALCQHHTNASRDADGDSEQAGRRNSYKYWHLAQWI